MNIENAQAGDQSLQATPFPREDALRPAEVVDNKRLSATLEFIKQQQRERTEARVAKPSTTRREVRLLRAGTSRRSEQGATAGTRP